MVGRLKLTFNILIAALVLMPAALTAQDQGRFRVLVPYFQPLEGAKDNFGKDASKELRELLNTLATHEPIEERDIKDEVKRFDMKIEDLDCIRTRQLAGQISAQVALCATYTQNPDKSWNVSGVEFWDIGSNEAFAVSDITVGEKEDDVAAQHIFNEFDLYVQQIRAVGICADYAASQQWENALRNCDQALELNPEGVSIRYQRAVILYEMDRMDESLEELERVLAVNGYHENALQRAGYIATIQGDKESGRTYYERYLELNPANAAVRMNIAYDLARAGDPVGAMALIQVGLDVDPENVDLWEQFGSFAFAAAVEAEQMAQMDAQDAGGLSPEAQGFYREAIGAYEKVFEGKGAETPVSHLRNIIAAYIQLDDLAAAVDVGGRVLQTHAQEDALWSIYADALQKSGRIDDAITALDRVREINPSYPNVALRQGNWLIAAGRVADAADVLKEAAAGNPQQAEQAARLIFADAYQNGVQKDNYAYAITGISAAKELPNLSSIMTSQLNFWHGYSIYTAAIKEQEPSTLATAQSTLPKFRAALGFFQQAEEYANSQPSITLSQFVEGSTTYIEIQDAIIKRGR